MRFVLSAVLCATCFGGASAFAETGVASEKGLEGFVTVDRLPMPEDPVLLEGRAIWEGTCQNCHGGNKYTGAPKITSTKAWSARIEQGLDVLINHAINGFVGPKYMEMPAKGANPDLSDDDVIAAILYMISNSGGDMAAMDYIKAMSE